MYMTDAVIIITHRADFVFGAIKDNANEILSD